MNGIKLKVITPSVPNFIKVEFGNGEIKTLPLTEFDDELLDAVAKAWRLKLYENQERQRKSKLTDAREEQE